MALWGGSGRLNSKSGGSENALFLDNGAKCSISNRVADASPIHFGSRRMGMVDVQIAMVGDFLPTDRGKVDEGISGDTKVGPNP